MKRNMKLENAFILIFIVSFIFLNMGLGLAQEIKEQEKVANLGVPETQWLWGEVVTVDLKVRQITVKYLDYETYQDKDMVISIDEQTGYENLKSIEEINPQDTVSIDYIVSLEGKNIARNISLEKPEGTDTSQEEVSEESQKEAPTKDKEE